ncbi:MAG TPA: hypothetical protein VN605_04430, partial [Thermoanaerobaculia bacterium]|nr:hypothetical protein [Thermoanaerobaculia bacterium]
MSDTADLIVSPELELSIDEHGLLASPRPSVNREKLQEHLREVLRLLHVNLDDENVRDTPRRWAES